MAFIRTVFAGSKTYGGYLSVDGGSPSSLSDGTLIKVDAGTHHIEYVNTLTPPAYYSPKGYVKGTVTAILEEDDLITFTIISDSEGHVLNVPSYEITKMSDTDIKTVDDASVSQFQYEMEDEVKALKKELFICLFLGLFGVHKFYKGHFILGILYLTSLGLLGIGWIIDLITIICKLIQVKKTIKRVQG